MKREPDFGNLLKVLERKVPDRPTLFEFFLNPRLYRELAGNEAVPERLMHIPAYRTLYLDQMLESNRRRRRAAR